MIGGAIRLPAKALRRSYFARLLQASGPFSGLLAQLAPARWALVNRNGWGPMEYFMEVWRHVDKLFPISEIDYESMVYDDLADQGEEEIEPTGELVASYAFDWGIPIIVDGLEWEDVYCYERMSPAVALTVWLFDVNHANDSHPPEVLKPHLARLAQVLQRRAEVRQDQFRLPTGRALRGKWKALPDLLNYCQCRTGNVFLDVSLHEVDQYPQWDIDEINGLAQQWKLAKPLRKAIKALTDYVDAQPADRLLDLGFALLGDRTALLEISAPAQGKTLAEIFAPADRQRVRV